MLGFLTNRSKRLLLVMPGRPELLRSIPPFGLFQPAINGCKTAMAAGKPPALNNAAIHSAPESALAVTNGHGTQY